MKGSLVISILLYGLLGFMLSMGGVGVLEKPMIFAAVIILVIVIENVGRWDEIGRRYRG